MFGTGRRRSSCSRRRPPTLQPPPPPPPRRTPSPSPRHRATPSSSVQFGARTRRPLAVVAEAQALPVSPVIRVVPLHRRHILLFRAHFLSIPVLPTAARSDVVFPTLFYARLIY